MSTGGEEKEVMGGSGMGGSVGSAGPIGEEPCFPDPVLPCATLGGGGMGLACGAFFPGAVAEKGAQGDPPGISRS